MLRQDQIEPLFTHFTQYYPDSPYVWKAYKAFANDLAKEQEYSYLLRVIEEHKVYLEQMSSWHGHSYSRQMHSIKWVAMKKLKRIIT